MLDQQSYQVLARKYRPKNFDELLGQDALVKTLTNAIQHNKIAHAFVLSGIRGVGKTTTARIIAKALNCIGKDGKSSKAQIPCNECENCQAITKSNFQDVLEIDAASRTGVDDMRSIIDSIGYAPAIGRYKVYIIDEVHMLSNSAFNALLKTLEEPPAHTKFIFATTEIKKIPVTVLSRCQRFDLRRLNEIEIENYLKDILKIEGFEHDDKILALIANAAQGSVRDSLSLLDRVLSCNNYKKTIKSDIFEEVAGYSDKSFIIDLFEKLMLGDVKNSILAIDKFYEKSSDISGLIQDLLDINHRITLCKSLSEINHNDLSKSQTDKIEEISSKLEIIDLSKNWQMLLKGLDEISKVEFNQKIALEMLFIRICHLNSLPNLDKLIYSSNDIAKTIESKPSSKDDLSGDILRNFSGAKIVS